MEFPWIDLNCSEVRKITLRTYFRIQLPRLNAAEVEEAWRPPMKFTGTSKCPKLMMLYISDRMTIKPPVFAIS